MINYPYTLELTGEYLERYLEINRRLREIEPTGEDYAAWEAKVRAASQKSEHATFFDENEITPRTLEAYARHLFGDPGKTPWLVPAQWELVILFCHEGLNIPEAARRCRLSEEGVRFRWQRTRRRIRRFPQIGSIVDVDRRTLNVGA